MSDASWYQRAVARARNQQEQPRYTPQAQAQGQAVYPAQWNQSPVSQPQQQFVTSPQGPVPTSQKMGQASTSDLLQMQSATGQATPGVGHQLNPNGCPSCGNHLYYEKLTKGPRRGPEPAPHCFACGYNGLFEQGLEGNWAG
jgi:hypothetical protein